MFYLTVLFFLFVLCPMTHMLAKFSKTSQIHWTGDCQFKISTEAALMVFYMH